MSRQTTLSRFEGRFVCYECAVVRRTLAGIRKHEGARRCSL